MRSIVVAMLGCTSSLLLGSCISDSSTDARGARQERTILYAYANPLSGVLKFVDHTWATDYPAIASCPNPAADYWYSAGDCHPFGGDEAPRLLAQAPADIALAKCIAQPNISTVDVGPPTALVRYGIDGVCHQITNRILAATAFAGAGPITVEGAHGYLISRFVYGAYGSSAQWDELKSSCTGKRSAEFQLPSEAEFGSTMVGTGLESKIPILQKERGIVRAQITLIGQQAESRTIGSRDVADRVNEAVNASLRRLEKSLTKEEFERMFGWSYGQEIQLADPDIASKVRYVR